MNIYDVGTSDLGDLWDNPLLLDSGLCHDTLMVCTGKEDDWSIVQDMPSGLRTSAGRPSSSNVVLRDRLMTDAALGGPKPIKTEHSYSLLACGPPSPARDASLSSCSSPCDATSNAARLQDRTPMHHRDHQHQHQHLQHHQHHQHHHHHHHQHHDHHQHHHQADVAASVFAGHHHISCPSDSSSLDVTDMEEECFPAISMNRASGRDSPRSSPEPFSSGPSKRPRIAEDDFDDDDDENEDNNEPSECCPVIKGEPLSPGSPCAADASLFFEDKSAVDAISPHSLHMTRFASQQTSDSEDDDEEMLQPEFKVEALDLPCEDETTEHQPTTSQELLPPTPPSTSCSDSESTVSASCSPERRDSHGSVHVHHQNLRGFLQPRLYVTTSGTVGQHTTTTRQPIHTPLISCQPKGSTGVLVLTEEEKRTLIAEGYPVPTKLPLTKQEEKSLKKVRRKIKNKISAQESRRKKKEYMDGLERRVTLLTSENSTYREKMSSLENSNRQLQKEVQRLQAIINRKSS